MWRACEESWQLHHKFSPSCQSHRHGGEIIFVVEHFTSYAVSILGVMYYQQTLINKFFPIHVFSWCSFSFVFRVCLLSTLLISGFVLHKQNINTVWHYLSVFGQSIWIELSPKILEFKLELIFVFCVICSSLCPGTAGTRPLHLNVH